MSSKEEIALQLSLKELEHANHTFAANTQAHGGKNTYAPEAYGEIATKVFNTVYSKLEYHEKTP